MADRTITLGFDPIAKFGAMWQDDVARTLWLLWRPLHLVPEGFEAYCGQIAHKIRTTKPTTAVQLIRCFPIVSDTWPCGDVERFAVGALPYFTGEKSIEWEYVQR